MPKKSAPSDPTSRVGKPQSAYGANKPDVGDYKYTDEKVSMDNRKLTNTDGSKLDESGRGRKAQQKDLDRDQTEGVAGAVPSYKKGGRVKKTGLAKLHKGERVIPRNKVRMVEKAVRHIGHRAASRSGSRSRSR